MANINTMTMDEMRDKLEGLYKRAQSIQVEIEKLLLLREQVIDDIEMCETIIMHQYNKRDRIKEYGN